MSRGVKMPVKRGPSSPSLNISRRARAWVVSCIGAGGSQYGEFQCIMSNGRMGPP